MSRFSWVPDDEPLDIGRPPDGRWILAHQEEALEAIIGKDVNEWLERRTKMTEREALERAWHARNLLTDAATSLGMALKAMVPVSREQRESVQGLMSLYDELNWMLRQHDGCWQGLERRAA